MNHIKLPDDPQLAGQVLSATVEHQGKLAEMGALGRFFGSRDNAAVYLAAIVIVLAMAAGGAIAVFEPSLRGDFMKSLIGLAIAAAGYMFGSGARSSPK